MRSPKFQGACRENEPACATQTRLGRSGFQSVQPPRVGHLSARDLGWVGGILLVSWAAASWLLQPGAVPLVAMPGGLILLWAFRDPGQRWSGRGAVGLGIGLLLVLSLAELRRRTLEASEPRDADRVLALARVRRDLDAVAARLQASARAGAAADLSDSERRFDLLSRLRARSGPLASVAILDRGGRPVAWSGRFLAALTAQGDSLTVARTSFYVVLEARRQRRDGGVALASAPIWRDAAVARGEVDSAAAIRIPAGVLVRFEPAQAGDSAQGWPATSPLLTLRIDTAPRQETVASFSARARSVLAWLLLAFLIVGGAAGRTTLLRVAPLATGVALALIYPVGESLGARNAFSPAWFFSPVAGPFSRSAGMLALSGVVVLLGGAALWGRLRLPRRAGIAIGVTLAVLVPVLIRALARGITPPALGVPTTLWLSWEAALFLPAFGLLVLAGALCRGEGRTGAARWPLLGAGASVLVAVIGVFVFTGRPGWPAWYTLLWAPGALLVIAPAATWASLTAIALAAGAGAGLMTWGNALAARTVVALADVANLGTQPDPLAEPALTELAASIVASSRPPDEADLYRAWRRSGLRREGYPVRLMVWNGADLAADVAMDALSLSDSALRDLVRVAPPGQSIARVAVGPGLHEVVVRRLDSSRVLALAVGPRTQLIPPAVLGRLLETGAERSPLYRLTVTPMSGLDGEGAPGRWRREAWSLRATRRVTLPSGPHEAHLLIPLGRPASILVRGGLLLLLDLSYAALAWFAVLWLLQRPVAVRPPWTTRSYETTLALTLAGFFVVPAALISAVSIRQLAVEAERSRDLVLQRVLRDATTAEGGPLVDIARRLDAGLGVYRGGELVAVSEPVLALLGVMPPLVDEAAWHALVLDGEPFASAREGQYTRRGFAVAGSSQGQGGTILATVHEERDRELRDRQLDVALGFGLATLLGLVAAGGAARLAARTLSRPVADLRDAALAFGRGSSAPPFPMLPPREFEPVFNAFARMAADVRTGQDALEAARRQTEAVLATVPTAVLAVDGLGEVILANRSAAEILGEALPAGRPLRDAAKGDWAPLAGLVAGRVRDGDLDFAAAGRRYVAQVTSLGGGRGAVIAVNDVTEATRAARVLAWADVANQVAHAIKNPLTPLRLGIQHLLRVREQRPDQFDAALGETTERLLAEISRLDSIARAFARFAAPSDAETPPAPLPLGEVCQEVAALYRIAPGFDLQVGVPAGVTAVARRDELKEVLLNLCDNARNAGAARVTLRWEENRLILSDDGTGIPPEVLAHVFEPRFSTTSSGSGLGLAIARRLVESWGATIAVESAPGHGARFTIVFAIGPTDRLTDSPTEMEI